MKRYVLDTNILIHDPRCIFSFQENEVYIPIYCIEEIDSFKREQSERGRNARAVARHLDELRELGSLSDGVTMPNTGKLFVTHLKKESFGSSDKDMDTKILACALEIKERNKKIPTIFITNDTNLRIRADTYKLKTETYETNSFPVDEMYSGYREFMTSGINIQAFHTNTCLPLDETVAKFYPNECIHIRKDSDYTNGGIGRYDAVNHSIKSLCAAKGGVWGIKNRNMEQAFALELLMDDSVKLVTLVGKAGTGKAQPLYSKVLTPSGWKRMGDISVGDSVCTPDGLSSKVLQIFPQGKKDIYRVYFTDESYTDCCEDHLWKTQTSLNRDQKNDGTVKSLKDIMATLRYGKSNKRNHSIPITKPVQFSEKNLPLDPYILGYLIANGGLTHDVGVSSRDKDVINVLKHEVSKYGCKVDKKNKYDYTITKNLRSSKKNPIKEILKDLGLMYKKSQKKFIPEIYKFGSVTQRIRLIQGLMDGDGTVGKTNDISYSSTSKQLIKDIKQILESLGCTATTTKHRGKYKDSEGNIVLCSMGYALHICPNDDINLFSVKRKLDRVSPRTKYFPRRYIDRVEKIGRKKAQCIAIDHPEHLYLTDNHIVTHNTLLALAAGLQKVAEEFKYDKLIVARPIQPMGKDIGYLPGGIEEKMNPWMQPIFDNVEFLMGLDKKAKQGGRSYQELIDQKFLQVEPLMYIRGRTIPKQFMIIDEAQNLTPHEVKTIITRAGIDTKIVLTGDPHQIDNPYIDATNNGLVYVVNKFKDQKIAGHITLTKGERSELAEIATNLL